MINIKNKEQYLKVLQIILCIQWIIYSIGRFCYGFIIINKAWMILLGMLFIFHVLIKQEKVRNISNDILSVISNAKILFFAFITYIIYDLISVLYTDNKLYSLKKYYYFVIFAFFFFLGCYIYQQMKKEEQLKFIKMLLGTYLIVIIFVGIYSYVHYLHFLPGLIIRQYGIATVSDYNQYAAIFLFGYAVSSYFLMSMKENVWKLIFAWMCLNLWVIPIIYMSTSRRSLFIVILLVIFYSLKILFMLLKQKEDKKILKFLFFIALTIIVTTIGYTLCKYLPKLHYEKYVDLLNEQEFGKPEQNKTNNSNVIERYGRTGQSTINSIFDGTATIARSDIWIKALSELKEYSTVEIIFGRGGSFSVDLYDNVPGVYPHNYWIEDILNGGIIKLIINCWITLTILFYSIKVIMKDREIGECIGICLGIVAIDLMISTQYSFFGDRNLLWVLLILVLANAYNVDNRETRG